MNPRDNNNKEFLRKLAEKYQREQDPKFLAKRNAFYKIENKIVRMFDGKICFHMDLENFVFLVDDTPYYFEPVLMEDSYPALKLFKMTRGDYRDGGDELYSSEVYVTNTESLAKALNSLKKVK